MAIDTLKSLADDVIRLLAAGGGVAVNDPGLCQRAVALRGLAESVPALVPIATAIERLLDAPPHDAGPRLFDLLAVVQRVRTVLTTTGVLGGLRPLAEAGPWASNLPSDQLSPLAESLLQKQSGRRQLLSRASKHDAVADLRLVEPLLKTLEDRNFKLADHVADRVLPRLGRPVLPELRAGLRKHGRSAEGRRLTAVCRIAPRLGARLCRDVLRSGNALLRKRALQGLAATSAKGSLDLILKRLGPENSPEVRAAALDAVRALGPAAKAAVPLIEEMLGERYPLGNKASMALAAVGKVGVAALVRAVRSEAAPARGLAISALGEAKNHGREAVAALMEVFLKGEPGVHRGALWTLQRLGEHAAPALPELTRLVADATAECRLRTAALEILPFVRGRLPKLLPLLIATLEDKDPQVAAAAARAIVQVGYPARRAVPDLIDGLDHDNQNVRETCARALGRMRKAATPAVPLLIARLTGKSVSVHTISQALHQLGRSAASGAPLLKALLADERADANARAVPARLLPGLGLPVEEVLPALKQAARDASQVVREAAVQGLERLKAAEDVGDELIRALRDEAMPVRRAAARALGIVKSTHDAVPALMTALADREAQVVHAATTALSQFGADAEPAIPALADLLKGTNYYGPWAVLNTLEKLAQTCPAAIDALSDAAATGRPDVARTASAILDRLR